MAAGIRDVILERGADFKETIIFGSGGVPHDVTGCTALGRFSNGPDGEVALEFSTALGTVAVGTTDGVIAIDIPGATTQTVESLVNGWWWIELTWPGGDIDRIVNGDVTFMQRSGT